ncbi:hypothetical protein SAMN05519103_00100 [Rhizobiales bacterium GAS113]|nr:hypothetical protein SAMN05519103_00100 [Rhizobiales bacterium GAS113]
MGVCRVIVLCAVMVILQSCSDIKAEFANRSGPEPILDAQAQDDAATRQLNVVLALASRAAGDQAQGERKIPLPNSPQDWYNVVLTGFNTVDDACESYLNDMWKLDRQRGTVQNLLTGTHTAVAAIIGSGNHPSAAALTTLAAAFGLGSTATDAIANTYLFGRNPAVIKALVKQNSDAYRAEIIKKGGASGAYSVPIVYYHVRQYLSLCLPSTIDGQIGTFLSKAGSADVSPSKTPPIAPPQLSALGRAAAPQVGGTRPDPSAPINVQFTAPPR